MEFVKFQIQTFTTNQTAETTSTSQNPNEEIARPVTVYDYFIALPVLIAAITPLILGVMQFYSRRKSNKQ